MILGTGIIIGLFGLVSIIFTGVMISGGEFKELNRFDYNVSVFGSLLRNVLLITASIMVFYVPKLSAIFVWGALFVFVLGALAVAFRDKRKISFSDFVPSFYYTCVALLVGAVILTLPSTQG